MSAVRNLRDFTTDRHHVVDDVPFGGGPGMVMKPEPFFAAMEAIEAERGHPGAVVLLTPAGRRFTQAEAGRLAGLGRIVLLCGRYEGVDERVRERWATDELSIGDYVLSGGELPALVVVDAVARLVAGRRRRRAVSRRGFVRARVVGLPALHEAGGVCRPAACPTCCCRATTPRFGDGGGSRRCGAPGRGGPTCSSRRGWTMKSRRGCGRGRPCRHRWSEREGSQ